jgi:CTP synthase (UTP-ammonia lyase)
MARERTIALVGDYSERVTAHSAIPKALELASATTGCPVSWHWVATDSLGDSPGDILGGFDAVWCVPASPYADMEGALGAIRYARERLLPFLGTCGGYQHAALEYARNVLEYDQAENAEVNPDAKMPLVAPLTCALVEQNGEIEFVAGSRMAQIYGQTRVVEKYHCSYGIAPRYLNIFNKSALKFTGYDAEGDPRAIELSDHPFFLATAFQPERSALDGHSHPLIEAFATATAGKLSFAA